MKRSPALDEAIHRLRALNDKVRIPLRLPTTAEVSEAEETLNYRFHPDYRKYLLEASDVVYGAREPATIVRRDYFTDLREVCKSAWESFGVPRHLLPICEDNADFFCMTQEGEVVFGRTTDGQAKGGRAWQRGSLMPGSRSLIDVGRSDTSPKSYRGLSPTAKLYAPLRGGTSKSATSKNVSEADQPFPRFRFGLVSANNSRFRHYPTIAALDDRPVSPQADGMPCTVAALMLRLKPKRRWVQFGARSMLVLTTACGILLGWRVNEVRRERDALVYVESLGGMACFDYQCDFDQEGNLRVVDPTRQPPRRSWLRSGRGVPTVNR